MKNVKEQIQKIFSQNKQVTCPAFLDEPVIFNAKGINHLMYKGNRSRREESRIVTNIRLLPRAIKVLHVMPLWQEESGYSKDGVKYRFWTFEAVIDDRRIKVIIRQVGNGKKHFWSVIPAMKSKNAGRRLGISRINLTVNQQKECNKK